MVSGRAFVGFAALIFMASVAATIIWCASMPSMTGMSMAWMRMPDQTWGGAAASFLGMWFVMMVAMMLPSLMPMLRRYRQAVGRRGDPHVDGLTALVATGYFFVWTLIGLLAYPLGASLANLTMQQPELMHLSPLLVGVIVIVLGALQLTPWKARQLACCKHASASDLRLPADGRNAWSHGLRLGIRCSRCCGGLMMVLLAIGVMDLPAMALTTAAITTERLAPSHAGIVRAIGVAVVAVGMCLTLRAIWNR